MSKNRKKNRPSNENSNSNNSNNSTANNTTNLTSASNPNPNPDTNTDTAPAQDFDPYNDDKTKEIVGSLFDEFVEDGGTNYFADYTDPFLDTENEDKESLGESISRRRRRAVTPTKKSIIFRMKPKKKKTEDTYEDDFDEDIEGELPEDDYISDIEDENPIDTSDDIDIDNDEPSDMEKTIILPKLSNFFKKPSDKNEDEDNDDEDNDDVDEFFAELNQKSESRFHSHPHSHEEDVDNDDISYERAEREPEPVPSKRRRSKNIFADLESPYDTGLNRDKQANENDDDDEYEERIVEVNIFRILAAAMIVVLVFVIIALCVKTHSLTKQLNDANTEIEELRKSSSSTLSTELEQLKTENESLKAENEELKGDSSAAEHAAAVEILGDTVSETTTAAQSASASTGSTTYTVKSGDNFWKISQSVYGNGANYQKILDANNLTENSQLKEGQVLTIPN
jgi:LysM repeat protein